MLIPSFALGRTQEMLALLALLMRAGKLKPQPIYIGGLGRVFTEIYDLEAHRTHRQHTNLQLHEALELIVLEKGQAEKMKLSGGRIFVITAGMMSENTAAHDLAARMIGDERQSIFFVGYADPDTPGGRLKAARPGETFVFSPSAGRVTRHCEVQDFDLTAHANREDLLDFVGQVSPRAILLGHGGDDSRAWFEEQIRARWPKIKILQPQPGQHGDGVNATAGELDFAVGLGVRSRNLTAVAVDDVGEVEDRQKHADDHAADDQPRKTISIGSMSDMRPESVASISSSRKLATRSSMLSMLPVCSPALIMRMIMLGKIGCLPSAAEMPSPRSMSTAAVLMAFSMTTLPTVWETICSTSRMGTPLRTSEASVRVKRARQILCAMGPKTGSLMRRASQKSRPVLVLMK